MRTHIRKQGGNKQKKGGENRGNKKTRETEKSRKGNKRKQVKELNGAGLKDVMEQEVGVQMGVGIEK